MDALLLAVTFLGVVCLFWLANIHGRTLLVAFCAGLGGFVIIFGIGAIAGTSLLAACVVGAIVAEVVFLVVCVPIERRERRREREEARIELETKIEAEKHRERSIDEMRDYWFLD